VRLHHLRGLREHRRAAGRASAPQRDLSQRERAGVSRQPPGDRRGRRRAESVDGARTRLPGRGHRL
jgi:hypothetical protein